jgi:hypothetical protein
MDVSALKTYLNQNEPSKERSISSKENLDSIAQTLATSEDQDICQH